MHADLASRCGGLGRWRRTLCAKRQECQAALAPATRGHCEESAACAPGVGPPRPRPGLGLRAQASCEPRLSAVPRPPGSLRARPRGPGSQTASVGLEEEDAEGKGRSHQSRQGRCDHQDLSLSTLNLTTWLTCCLWSLSGSSTAKVSFPPFPMLRLAAGSPHEQPAGRAQRTPAPGGGGPAA